MCTTDNVWIFLSKPSISNPLKMIFACTITLIQIWNKKDLHFFITKEYLYRFEWRFERLDVKIFLNFVFRKSKFGRAITARCHGHQHSGKETIGAHKPARAQSEWNHYQPSPATNKQRPTLVWSKGLQDILFDITRSNESSSCWVLSAVFKFIYWLRVHLYSI